MNWGKVELEAIEILSSISWREKIVESFRFVGAEVVHHNPDAVSIRVVFIRNLSHTVDPILGLALLSTLDVTPSSQRFRHHEQFASAVFIVMMVDTLNRTGLIRERINLVITKEFV